MTEEMLKTAALLAATSELFRQAAEATDHARGAVIAGDTAALNDASVRMFLAITTAEAMLRKADMLISAETSAARSVDRLDANSRKGVTIQ
jgi:hypothetical protein